MQKLMIVFFFYEFVKNLNFFQVDFDREIERYVKRCWFDLIYPVLALWRLSKMILMILGDHASAFIPFFLCTFADSSLVQMTVSLPPLLLPLPLVPSLIFHYMMKHRHMCACMLTNMNSKIKLHMLHCSVYNYYWFSVSEMLRIILFYVKSIRNIT